MYLDYILNSGVHWPSKFKMFDLQLFVHISLQSKFCLWFLTIATILH